jgi:hypothetical protein
VATDLTRIGQKARKEPELVFTSLYHHIYDVDNLRACYDTLGADKATGVDGVTKPSGPVGQAQAYGISSGAETTQLHTEAGE